MVRVPVASWFPEQDSPAVRWRGNPWWLFAYAVSAALLLFGWWGDGPMRPFWDHLDRLAFDGLNGSMADRPGIRLFWAITNSRYFDLVTGSVVLACYGMYLFADGRRRLVGRFLLGGGMAVFVAIWMQGVMKTLIDYGRVSPTLVLPDAVRIGQEFDFIPLVKDLSRDSFPGDHFGMTLMIALILCHVAGARVGACMLLVAALSVFPRVAGGAHWLTDQLVGGGFAGFTGATCFLLPVWWWSRQASRTSRSGENA
ncbi:MAG: phosphatase PAP2 family protein [Ahniella sp.]|nr:phosphatase PAP2 family protein [Ahniella sp.]